MAGSPASVKKKDHIGLQAAAPAPGREDAAFPLGLRLHDKLGRESAIRFARREILKFCFAGRLHPFLIEVVEHDLKLLRAAETGQAGKQLILGSLNGPVAEHASGAVDHVHESGTGVPDAKERGRSERARASRSRLPPPLPQWRARPSHLPVEAWFGR